MPPRPLSELPPSSWDRNPDYVIDLELLPFRVRAEAGGEVLVDSRNAKVMLELGHAPVYYIAREDVRMDRLQRSDHSTHYPIRAMPPVGTSSTQ